jgi:hypothetical protein
LVIDKGAKETLVAGEDLDRGLKHNHKPNCWRADVKTELTEYYLSQRAILSLEE